MKRIIAKYISILLVIVATAAVSTASVWLFHRPEVPEELLKK